MNKIVVNEPQQNVEHLKLNGNKYGSIYKIIFPNGKHYIGLTTTSLEQRKKEHKKGARLDSSKILYKAIRKYDMIDTIDLIEIDTADTIEELYSKEIQYIKEYNSYYLNRNGYNMTYGGEGANGYTHTEEERAKASERSKMQWSSQEAREQMSEIKKLYYENHPEAGKEHGVKMKEYFKNHPEVGKERSVKMKEYYENHPETRLKASERTREQFSTQEARERHSEIMNKRFDKQEERDKISEGLKEYHKNNPEAREQIQERSNKYWANQEARDQAKERATKQWDEQARKDKSEAVKKYYADNPEAGKEYGEKMKRFWADPEVKRKRADKLGQNKPFDVFKCDDNSLVGEFAYQFEANDYLKKEYNIASNIHIGGVLAGKRKSSHGFTFKYKSNIE